MANYKKTGNYKNSGGLLQLIENYTFGSTITTKTFTISPALNMDDHSMLMLVMDVSATASLALQAQVNGYTTSTYNWDSNSTKDAANTPTTGTSDTSIEIVSTALLSTAGAPVHVVMYIMLNKSGSNDRITIHSHAVSPTAVAIQECGGGNTTAVTEIDAVTIKVSTSSLQANGRMTLYKVKRT